jgi:hypothetical protein
MTFLEELDIVIEKYFSHIIENFNFVLYETNDKGMGALRKYKNDSLKIQVLNDRGIINLNVSSVFDKEDFRDTEIVNSMIELENLSTEIIGKWDREKILNKRLELKEQANLINKNWELLKRYFDEKNYKNTMKQLEIIGIERTKIQSR